MIALEAHDDGVLLPVRARAGARRNELRGEHNGALKVCVTQVAEKGKANQAIIQLLSKTLGIAKTQLVLVSGSTSADKKILVIGETVESLLARLEPLVD